MNVVDNSGAQSTQWYPSQEPSEEDKVEREEARDTIATSVKAIPKIIKWYEDRIEYYKSPANFPIEETMPAEDIKRIALTCQHFSTTYENELQLFLDDVKDFMSVQETPKE